MRLAVVPLLLGALLVLPATARAGDITPTVDCLTDIAPDSGHYWVYWGYVDRDDSRRSIPVGDQNQISPGLQYQGQPTVLNPGVYPRVFRSELDTSFTPQVEWELDGHTVVATAAARRCIAGATGTPVALTPTSARLAGVVQPLLGPTTWSFEWGTTTDYGATTPVRQTDSTLVQSAEETITGLAPSTTYHVRLVATTDGLSTKGEDRTFTTPPEPGPVKPPPPVVERVVETVQVPVEAPLAPAADVRLTAGLPSLRRGRTATLRLAALNRGTAAATDALVRVVVGNAKVVRRPPECSRGAIMRCRLAPLAPGGGSTLAIRLRAPRRGSVSVAAHVAHGGPATGAPADRLATLTRRVR